MFLGALRQVGIAGRDLAGARHDRFGAGAHLAHDAQDIGVHVSQGLQQLAGLIAAVDVDATGQVAGSHGAGHGHGAMQGARDAAGKPDREGNADPQHHHAQPNQAVARVDVDGIDLARGGVDAGALDVEQLLDLGQVGVAGGHELLLQHLVGFLGQPFLLELRDLVAAVVVRVAHAQDLLERGLFLLGAEHRLQLVAQLRNAFDRRPGLGGKELAQRRVGAARHRGGAAHAGMHEAVPVADQPLLGQRLLHHRVRALGHLLKAQHAQACHQRRKQQNHPKTHAEANPDT
ncbi:hypothetical protein CBM2589_A90233 [Cupriavidus taiwanensis]|uniref:Uncharacterized protein n=1 Tax=Cupriavidus taiwanensis TaxID=164546 RepID=A0A975XFY8_9BURK|nr:hypothetical protein CBM2589_A90233 [Cupriavidus taiwanensis]